MPPPLAVFDLVKSYGSQRALAGVSFEVGAGLTGLLGPNGAGKTTLFQILTGLFAADAGRVEVFGEDVRLRPTQALGHIGAVFQQPSLDLDLNVGENLRYYAGLRGLGGSQRANAVDEALAIFGLADERRVPCRRLSGGTRRKVEVARAFIGAPEILLLDEPTTGLDPASRTELVRYVADLARERRLAVLWATHLVQDVEQAERIVVLHAGRVAAVGSPQEICACAGTSPLESAFLSLTAPPGEARPAQRATP